MVSELGLPLNFFESPAVRRTYECLLEQVGTIDFKSAGTIKTYIQDAVAQSEEKLKAQLSGTFRVAIALDGWHAGVLRASFLTIRCYWIDEKWIWHEAMLAFPYITGSHTGNHLADILFDTLTRFNIHERLMALTADNAANNNTLYTAMYSFLVPYYEC